MAEPSTPSFLPSGKKKGWGSLPTPEAYERVVDRLLAAPRYGYAWFEQEKKTAL